jgi:hypothetical protein
MAAARTPDPDAELLGPAVTRLIARFGQHIEADTIRRILHDTYSALQSEATVTAFLPLLAERSAASQLTNDNDNDNQPSTDAHSSSSAPPPPSPSRASEPE